MQIVRDYRLTPRSARGAVLAIGNFDGLHLGHRAVLAEAKREALRLGAPLAVMSFEPHPRRFFAPGLPPMRLFSASEKLRLLREAGVESVFAQRFQADFANLDATLFLREVLKEKLAVRHVVTGEGFVFGKGRGGNSAQLAARAEEHGFGYSTVPQVAVDGAPCSSTRIRAALADGDLALAKRLLGRDYALQGRVARGDARGRILGFPTANLLPHRLFLPRYGVYAVRAKLPGGAWQAGVANLGIRPTVGGERVLLEVHLFDFAQAIYGEKLEVHFHQFLRPERKFDGLDALKAQIVGDAEVARRFYAERG